MSNNTSRESRLDKHKQRSGNGTKETLRLGSPSEQSRWEVAVRQYSHDLRQDQGEQIQKGLEQANDPQYQGAPYKGLNDSEGEKGVIAAFLDAIQGWKREAERQGMPGASIAELRAEQAALMTDPRWRPRPADTEITANMYREPRQTSDSARQEEIREWHQWLTDPSAQGYWAQLFRNAHQNNVEAAYEDARQNGDLHECNQERLAHQRERQQQAAYIETTTSFPQPQPFLENSQKYPIPEWLLQALNETSEIDSSRFPGRDDSTISQMLNPSTQYTQSSHDTPFIGSFLDSDHHQTPFPSSYDARQTPDVPTTPSGQFPSYLSSANFSRSDQPPSRKSHPPLNPIANPLPRHPLFGTNLPGNPGISRVLSSTSPTEHSLVRKRPLVSDAGTSSTQQTKRSRTADYSEASFPPSHASRSDRSNLLSRSEANEQGSSAPSLEQLEDTYRSLSQQLQIYTHQLKNPPCGRIDSHFKTSFQILAERIDTTSRLIIGCLNNQKTNIDGRVETYQKEYKQKRDELEKHINILMSKGRNELLKASQRTRISSIEKIIEDSTKEKLKAEEVLNKAVSEQNDKIPEFQRRIGTLEKESLERDIQKDFLKSYSDLPQSTDTTNIASLLTQKSDIDMEKENKRIKKMNTFWMKNTERYKNELNELEEAFKSEGIYGQIKLVDKYIGQKRQITYKRTDTTQSDLNKI